MRQSPKQKKWLQHIIINAWKESMPTIVTKRTKKMFMKEDILFIQLASAPLKHELEIAKKKLIQSLHVQIKEYNLSADLLKDIVFL